MRAPVFANSSRSVRSLAALPLVLCAAGAVARSAEAEPTAAHAAAEERAGKRPKVLFFTKSSGFEHACIKTDGTTPSHAERIVAELGARAGVDVTHSKDGSVFTREGLAPYAALIFYTSGDLTKPGTDGQPPFPPDGKATLIEAIAGGKGLLGFHAASDTFLTPGDRYRNTGADTDPFIKLLGGEFIIHGSQQKARVFCSDRRFPGLADCGESFELLEEWYSLRNFAPDLHVLQWIATWSVKNHPGGDAGYRRPPYPVTWIRRQGKGRVFFSALGHREDVWEHPLFQSMFLGALDWVIGRKAADTRPNLAQVTPLAAELPPRPAPPAPGLPAPGAAPAAGAPATK
jgi:hypothetical protein